MPDRVREPAGDALEIRKHAIAPLVVQRRQRIRENGVVVHGSWGSRSGNIRKILIRMSRGYTGPGPLKFLRLIKRNRSCRAGKGSAGTCPPIRRWRARFAFCPPYKMSANAAPPLGVGAGTPSSRFPHLPKKGMERREAPGVCEARRPDAAPPGAPPQTALSAAA